MHLQAPDGGKQQALNRGAALPASPTSARKRSSSEPRFSQRASEAVPTTFNDIPSDDPQPGCMSSLLSATHGSGMLVVTISGCNNLQGDRPYCVCEVRHRDEWRQTAQSRIQTDEGVGVNPEWHEEIHFMDSWHVGDALVFTVMAKDKIEGRAVVSSDQVKHGFDGELELMGDSGSLSGSKLRVKLELRGEHGESCTVCVIS